jgi:hypothetical protein
VEQSGHATSPTGAQLGYDNEGRLANWQNQPSNPSTTDNFLSDGEGNRVEQQWTTNGTTTTLIYVGGAATLEKVNISGGTTSTTSCCNVDSKHFILNARGLFIYLSDGALGSQMVILRASRTLPATPMYRPFEATPHTRLVGCASSARRSPAPPPAGPGAGDRARRRRDRSCRQRWGAIPFTLLPHLVHTRSCEARYITVASMSATCLLTFVLPLLLSPAILAGNDYQRIGRAPR